MERAENDVLTMLLQTTFLWTLWLILVFHYISYLSHLLFQSAPSDMHFSGVLFAWVCFLAFAELFSKWRLWALVRASEDGPV